MVADNVIKEFRDRTKTDMTDINQELEYHKHVEGKIDELAEERKEFLTT